MLELTGQYASCKIFNDDVEEEAIKQVYGFLNHPAFENLKIRIMPDIHAGSGAVIGFTSSVGNKIIPNVIGVDIGCGVNCYSLGNINIDFQALDTFIRKEIPYGHNIRSKTASRTIMDKAYSVIKSTHKINTIHLSNLSGVFLDTIRTIAKSTGQKEEYVINSLGTLGGGNHYIEIDKDEDGNKFLNIHSGSRNFGLKIAEFHQKIAEKQHPHGDLSYLSEHECMQYCFEMSFATIYARLNREIMAQYIMDFLKVREAHKIESVHNYIDFKYGVIRKGAISAKLDEEVVIPWNMQDGIILGKGRGNEDWNESAPHGAGRIMGRNVAKKTLDMDEYKARMEGIWTSCVNSGTLDEAPMAYKDHTKIEALLEPTVEITARLKPAYNFKSSDEEAMAVNMKIEKLLAGETIISKEPGNSMLSLIKSRQPCKIAPATWEQLEVGDIAYCKVHGNVYTHLVKAKDANKGLLIGNNHGHDNGWTKTVYGKVIEVLPN